MPSRVVSPSFVGRREELGLLEEAFSRATAGEPSLVLVGGEAGVGKTRLVGEVADHAREAHDATVLTGGCLDLGEATMPYAPLVEALRDLSHRLSPDGLRAVLGPARRPLARLLPDLDRSPAGGPPNGASDGSSQAGLFEAVLGVLARLAADHPLALALEDLHWADRATLDLLVFLAHNLRTERVVLVGTFRSDELHRHHPLRPVLSELVRLPNVERIDLPRFDRTELAELLAAILDGAPDDPLVDDVLARSEGNPFYAEELLVATLDDGRTDRLPDSLREILIDRVASLPPAAREVLRIAAAVGRDVEDRLLEEIADLPAAELRQGLREALAHQVLVIGEDGETLRFRHALVQEAVHQDLLPSERAGLHAAIAAALERRPDLSRRALDALHGELAHHWYAAHDLPRAFVASVAASAHAYDVFAFTAAQHHYERALALWERVPAEVREETIARHELLSRAAAAAGHAGDGRRALTHQQAAIDALPPDASSRERAGYVEQLSHWHHVVGHGDQALAIVDEALAACPAEALEARARLLARRGRLLMLVSRYEEAVPVAREAAELARTTGARRMEGVALNALGAALAFAGDVDAGVVHLRAAVDIALELEDIEDVLSGFNNISAVMGYDGRLEEAYEAAMAGVRWAEERGTTGTAPHFARVTAARVLYSHGRWEEADVLLREVVLLHGQDVTAIHYTATAALLRTGQGRLEEARRLLGRGIELTRDEGQAQFVVALVAAEIELACWEGRPLDAGQPLRRALGDDEIALWGLDFILWPALRAQTDAATAADDPEVADRARATLLELLDRARQRLATEPVGTHRGLRLGAQIATAEAELTRLDGEPDPAAWRRAVETAEATGFVYETALVRWRLAEAILSSDGDRDTAAEELGAAHKVATDLGARPLREAVEALARRARVALPGVSDADDGDLGLTPREREVLALVAAGRTNRQIGEALFIAEKTASVHVSNILAKLGVTSRGEAAAVAHRLGLDAAPLTDLTG